MLRRFRSILKFLKAVSIDTHLWCFSVIVGAILLCTSFFVNPFERIFVLNGNVVSAQENEITVISDNVNYGSVVGKSDLNVVEDTDDGIKTVEGDLPISLEDGSAVSVEEFDALCRIIECEASGEDVKGRILVGNVILNRVKSEKFPNTIEDVITSPGQFDPVKTKAYYVAYPSTETKEAAMRALNGEDYSEGALYFQKSESQIWGNKTFLFRYSSHSFYK